MIPLTTSELIFSEQANHNFSKTLGELKRHTLSLRNRLQSILEDAAFVQRVSAAYRRPLIANERCGSWYIEASRKDDSAYFKSTDGHTGVWSFSTRRLNIHLLETIGKHDGCIIVDSTRRGKRMPDALSKTIPIWCSVLNRALFPDIIESHQLYTPPQVVSSSEHAQIATHLEEFLRSFLALEICCSTLRAQLTKPMRPMWVTPESYISSENTIFEDYHPIICCTASRRVVGGEISEGGYIQGSGDDTENWAFGLTPPIFWAHIQLLLSTPESDLPETISNLIVNSSLSPSSSSPRKARSLIPIPPTTTLCITDLTTAATHTPTKHHLLITLHPELIISPSSSSSRYHLPLPLGPHKLGSRNLRTALPKITSFVSRHLSNQQSPTPFPSLLASSDNSADSNTPADTSISLACSTATDHSVGAALAILCLFYNNEGRQFQLQHSEQEEVKSSGCGDGGDGSAQESILEKQEAQRVEIDKTYIRRRLGWIVTAMPAANPSGATLQSVNGFLMPRR